MNPPRDQPEPARPADTEGAAHTVSGLPPTAEGAAHAASGLPTDTKGAAHAVSGLPADAVLARLFAEHTRRWRDFRYVYPVISRRSGGLSIGINLHPDRTCNFDCVYCQVDRRERIDPHQVDPARLADELNALVQAGSCGAIFADEAFADTPASHRVLRDIAFSGDGEPTTSILFSQAVEIAIDARARVAPPAEPPRLILITNASCLDQPTVRAALDRLDAHGGEIWAKLDAGTESGYQRLNRSRVPFRRVLDNITACACRRSIVIQSMWLRLAGAGPEPAEVTAFADRLREILAAGGAIRLVQIYTVARPPAEAEVSPLELTELNTIADTVREATQLRVAVFGA